MTIKPVLSAAATVAMILTGGCGDQSTQQLGGRPSPTLTTGDNKFFRDAAQSDLFEVQSSDLALQNASADPVKQFAQHMRHAHDTMFNTLNDLARAKNVQLPTVLDNDHQAMLKDLRDKSGADFDKAYISQQVDAHQMAINLTRAEADNGADNDVKSFALAGLTDLRAHLQEAKQVKDGMMAP